MVRIDGFKEYREKVYVQGCTKRYDHFIFLEFDDEIIRPVILDFTGEVNEIVDVTELKRTFPKKAVTEFERAREDRLQGDPNRARVRLESSLPNIPISTMRTTRLDLSISKLKRFRDAERQYNEARKLKPTSAAPLVSLGSLYVEEAEASINPPPGVVGVVLPGGDLGIILSDAREVLAEALKLKPDASFAYYLSGALRKCGGGELREGRGESSQVTGD